MYCTNCGQPIANDANFCGHCGQRIVRSDHMSSSETTVNDLVANKAEDIIIKDDNIAYSDNLSNDDIAKKATFIGETSYPDTLNIKPTNISEYNITRETFLVDYLFLIKRENISNHNVSYCLLDTKIGKQSEWFDNISYCGHDIFHIKRNSLEGLMESSFEDYQLWDQMNDGEKGYYCVAKNKKWAIITIRNKKIEQLTPYEYDHFSFFVEDAAIVKQNGKYGYFIYDNDTKKMRLLPRVLDDAKEFNNEGFADVIHQGKHYKMNKKGDLYVKDTLKDDWWVIALTAFFYWLPLIIVVGTLYNVFVNGMSINDAYKAPISFDGPTITIGIITYIIAVRWSVRSHKKENEKIENCKFVMNIASKVDCY